MKNFVRLVRFTWPYRGRFWLSLVCAAMVAVLGGATISAVLPLLKILLNGENCQKWMAGEIRATESEIEVHQARLDELRMIAAWARRHDSGDAVYRAHLKQLERDLRARKQELEQLEARFEEAGPRPATEADPVTSKDDLEPSRQALEVAEARLNEFVKRAREPVRDRDLAALTRREATLKRDLAQAQKWLRRYRRLQPQIDRYLPHDGFKTLLLLLGLVMAGVVLKGFFQFLQDVLVADIMQLSLFDIRNQFFRRTMALDLASFSDQGSAELMARFTNDMDSLSQGLNTLLGKVIREPLRIVSCLCVALMLNWRLTCLILILVPVSAATTVRVGKIMKRAVRRSLESMSSIYKILQESFQGIKVVKAFTMERYERRRFFLETKSLYKKSVRVATIDALSDPFLELLALSTVAIALLAGGYLVLRSTRFLDLGMIQIQLASQTMAIEDLLTIYAMLGGIADPVRKLANVHSRIQRAAAASDRICALMDRRPQVADTPASARLPRHRKTIEFDGVEFAYQGRDLVLRGIDLAVRHGETIALVGPNGCGKTTLVNLLPRFWDVTAGAIRIDGHDLRSIRLRSLRSQIGMVTQETILFDDTIAHNIAYGNRHASRAEIEAAARRAYAHQFIAALPDGYDTNIGDRGMSLSGGQRQRIALARVMLRDPAILILDEATSAVDIRDEALIRKAIEEFARDRTTFLITHSLGSLQFADRIVLLDGGRVEAIGTDSELRRTCPLYHRLHEIHFQRESA